VLFFKVWLLLKAYYFCSIFKLRDYKLSHHKSDHLSLKIVEADEITHGILLELRN
jgi:hypothetical protein